MSFPPLQPSSNSVSSGDSKPSNPGSVRPRQSAWGLSAPSTSRRGLTPLATNVPSSSDASVVRPDPTSPSTGAAAASPFAPSFSSVLHSANRAAGARNHSSSTASPFPPLQAGSTQQPPAPSGQPLSSPRSRATTPFSTSILASSAAGSTTASQGGGSSGGGGPNTRGAAFSPSLSTHSLTSPTNSTFDRGPLGSSSQSSSQSSVSKIVVTQVFLLLGSITEKEGKAKWDSQAEAIRKLVDAHGIEVFAKYLRRLLVSNSHIFAGNARSIETPGNHQLLVQEIEKASQDLEQAKKVAEVIDTSEGDIFRDFDLATFIAHFKLHPLRKVILVASFTEVSKPDLRAKASAILSSTVSSAVQTLGSVQPENDIPTPIIATAVFTILRDLHSRDGPEKILVSEALETRYSQLERDIPPAIESAMALAAVFTLRHELADEITSHGPSCTDSVESAKDAIRRFGFNRVDEIEIASALMYMLLAPDAEQWSPDVFVSTLRECLNSINWNLVTRAFDRDGMILTQTQFYSLFRSLLPLANSPSELDIQSLWGGEWQHPNTQLSFAINLASLSSAQLDATTIPGLRRAFEPRHCLDGPKEVVAFAEGASKDPLVSLDAVLVIGQALWGAPPALPSTLAKHLRSVISSKTTLFICAASGIPQPWDKAQEDFFKERLRGCFMKTQPDHQIILYVLWKQDQQWLHYKLMEFHTADPITLNILFEHIVEHEWLKDLCGVLNGFAIDLAALAHRKGMLDFRQWAEQQYADRPADVITSFSKFLQIKAQDEIRMIRKEQPAPCTVSLSVKTVNTILEFLEENAKEKRVELNQLERQCMQAFPRLCNYGEGFDEVIEANGAENNILPVTADLDMQDYYKRMYNGELEVRHIIEGLRDCKTSEESAKQDLFACMIHGLFDEFVCFNEYPLGPLATTAVLFGGIINYRLINNIALNIALEMVLESVREYATDTSMYKFGLQALLHFQSRFSEWPDFCQRLVQIPGLQGTEPYGKAREALREEEPDRNGETNGVHDLIDSDKMTNGNMDDFITDSLVPHFRSVNVDPYSNLDAFEDPDASIQDKILFVLNNVTEQNLHHKITGITDVLLPQHFHWFASHLVEQRAKSQPNYQPLYLDLLGRINQKFLWAEVLRETFLGLRKILNAVSTMKNPMERTHLKHLGIWLGLLTLARDKPIKHKNLSFRDLLIEGWETSRLLLVIPFTCEVLAQGAKSRVFKPPNPWVMEVIGLLLELYDLPDLKIQQKFAVEVLLGTFGMPRNGEGIERSTELKKRQAFEDPHENLIQDNMEPFEELALGSLTKGLRNARLTQPSIQELENSITLPPASSTPINQAQLRHLVATAVQRSINEIIGPVVERSVTIATISTKDLICKDYAQEPSEERVREAFEQMAKALSGSLAAVTCKEPMRMSMGNYIRMGAAEMPEPLPEGSVLMCVNDNLEMACKIVEKQAADSAIPEIEPHVENEVAKRRKHKAEFPNEPYRDPVASHWSSYIPEPYKQTPGGLNQQQLDIYQHFAPQLRGNHVASGSADSGKQIPDVLQEPNFPNIPNLPTPAEAPAVPQQPQSQQQPAARPLPAMSNSRPSAQSNGYLDPPALQNHIQELIAEMVGATEETPDQRFRDLGRGSPVLEMLTRIVNLVRSSNDLDQFTFIAAAFICPMLYGNDTLPRLGAEVLVQLLKQMCHLSEDTLSKLIVYFRQQPDEKILNIPVTAALLEIGLLEFMAVDMILAQGLHNKKVEALHVLSGLLDSLLFGPDPVALRADFVHSLGEMGQWLSEDSNLKPAESIMSRLKAAGIQEPTESSADEAQQKTEFQMQYIFSEWVTLFSQLGPSDKVLVGFIAQLHERKAFEPAEKMMIFLRRSIDVAVESLERPNMDTTLGPHAVHSTADALASLIVLLVKYKGENATDGDAKGTKASYMKSILSLVVLVTNNHHVMRGEHFNQKAFFRIFSMVFFGWHDLIRGANIKQDRSMIHVFGETLLLLEPSNFPAFVYGWMSLVSHRIFMPAILKIADKEGSDLFLNLIEVLLAYVGEMLKPEALSGVAKELHRGVLRILLVLHHDFPEFLADNHFRLCNIIPPHCTQLRNLVLSAFPSSILELPDPFASGLKVDRLDDIRKSPNMNGDIIAPLSHDNLKEVIDRALASGSVSNQTVSSMIDAVSISPKETEGTPNSTAINPTVLHAIVIYLGQSAIATTPNGFVNGPSFSGDSVPIVLMSKLAKEFPPEARYRYLSAIANQLRYPNSHTHFFSFALLQLFGTDQNDQQESDVRQQITRILLERLIVHRPHPWGLIITLLELLKNSTYQFMELPFIKAAPEVGKIFHTFFEHLNQGSRQIV